VASNSIALRAWLAPNPVSGPYASLGYELGAPAKSVTVEIYGLDLAFISKVSVSERHGGMHAWVLEASKLSAGIYFCRVTAEGVDGGHEEKVLKFAVIR
jgi:hypothetical protein